MGVTEVSDEPAGETASPPLPGSVRWLTVALACAGVLAAVAAMGMPGASRPGLPPAAVFALLASLTAAGRLQLRFSHREQTEALDLFDAVLAPVVFFFAAPAVVAVVAVAVVGCDLLLRTRPAKACFNVAQWLAAAGMGTLCFAALARGEGVTGRNVAALAVAMGAVACVNHVAMVTVLSLVTRGPVRGVLSAVAPIVRWGWVVAGLVNLAFGLLLIGAIYTGAWATALVPVSLWMLHWANRGYAEGRADRARLAGLQRATHALVGPLDPRDAVADFLVEVRRCFDVETAELVLQGADGTYSVQRLAGPDAAALRSWSLPADDADTLSVALLRDGATRTVGSSGEDDVLRALLWREGWRDCTAAPLRSKGQVRGVLCVYDRNGLEGFEDGALAVLEALATELAGALEKAELVDAVLHQALHDALTGLPNRTLFTQRVQSAIAGSHAARGRVAVMLIDVNRFKEVNDTLGHHRGDLLLQDLSARIRASLRPDDIVARLGGDEFAVVVPRVAGPAEAAEVAERVLAALVEPFLLEDLALHVDASIGIALHPEHGEDPATLLQRADVAMYAAKGAQRGQELYAPENDRYSPRRLALVGELHGAASQGELRVHYQPKSDLRTGRVTGVEALLRWEHPRHGRVAPDEFIPVAEQTGAIGTITTFVLEEAVAQCGEWRRAGLHLDVAVNLSVRSLLDIGLASQIERLLAHHQVPAHHLTLEVTESSVMSDPARTVAVLKRLHAMGVQLSIDDYGTGYSSLSHVRRLPVDEMKIDRSFVASMANDDDDALIVRSTVDLGHNLGLRVVAEGVEDEATWRRLAELGCDVAQGYYVGRPLPAAEVVRDVARLNHHHLAPAASGAA